MTNKYDNEFKTMNQDEAVALWKQGKDAWNEKIAENPKINIDFSGVDFPKDEGVSFKGFIFPEGTTDFNHAKFSEYADFIGAEFNGTPLCQGSCRLN